MFLHGCYLALRSRSKVGVKVKGQGQGKRSGLRSNFRCTAVDNRSSALPSAAMSNKSHYQFKVFVCLSVISRRMQIIARMRSIGVLFPFAIDLIIFRSVTRDGPIPDFCRYADMPILTSADMPILPIPILLERALSQISNKPLFVKIGPVEAEILRKMFMQVS